MSEATILILGVGNILLGDEGVGVRVVELLQERYTFDQQVELVDGGTAGLELLSCLDGKDEVIIIDAMAGEAAAGTVTRMELDNPPAFFQNRISPHQLGLSEMLSCAAMTDSLPDRITLYGVVPQSLETGLDLSEPVTAAMEDIAAQIVNDLQHRGMAVPPKMAMASA